MGAIRFDSYFMLFSTDNKIAMSDDCCCDNICSYCPSFTQQLDITFSGIINCPSNIVDCESEFNESTFRLTRDSSNSCKWSWTGTDSGGNSKYVIHEIGSSSVFLQAVDNNRYCFYRVMGGSGIECSTSIGNNPVACSGSEDGYNGTASIANV